MKIDIFRPGKLVDIRSHTHQHEHAFNTVSTQKHSLCISSIHAHAGKHKTNTSAQNKHMGETERINWPERERHTVRDGERERERETEREERESDNDHYHTASFLY